MLLMKGNHEKHEDQQNKEDSDDLGGTYPPPLTSKPLTTISSSFMGMPFNLPSFNPKQLEEPPEPEDTEMEAPATFKAPDSISSQLQNLLDLCNSTIEYYQNLSQKVDISTLTTSPILPSLSTTFGYESTDYPSKNWPNKPNFSQLHLHPIWKTSTPPQTTSTTSNDTQSPPQPTVTPTPNLMDHSIILDSHAHTHSHSNDPHTGDMENHPAPDPDPANSGDDH